MSESKKPITRTRQEVKNIDIDETKYVKKEDQYAYGINTFTTENDNLTAMEIVSKDKGTTANVKFFNSIFSPTIKTNYQTSYYNYINYSDKSYLLLRTDLCRLQYVANNNLTWSFEIYKTTIDNVSVFAKMFKINTYLYFAYDVTGQFMNPYDIVMSQNTFDKLIHSYQHTLTISKGNEFEGLVIKFRTKPLKYNIASITTPQLFINNINYIKDVVGFILKDGVVTPYVFTYKDDTLYLNGSEIDVNSLTITDDVVTL